MTDLTEYPHVNAAFINAIAEEGTKAEAITWLQKLWNENCALRKDIAARKTAVWHPAETAPKDGRTFYATQWFGTFELSPQWALFWNGEAFESTDNKAELVTTFTHWMIPDGVT